MFQRAIIAVFDLLRTFRYKVPLDNLLTFHCKLPARTIHTVPYGVSVKTQKNREEFQLIILLDIKIYNRNVFVMVRSHFLSKT